MDDEQLLQQLSAAVAAFYLCADASACELQACAVTACLAALVEGEPEIRILEAAVAELVPRPGEQTARRMGIPPLLELVDASTLLLPLLTDVGVDGHVASTGDAAFSALVLALGRVGPPREVLLTLAAAVPDVVARGTAWPVRGAIVRALAALVPRLTERGRDRAVMDAIAIAARCSDVAAEMDPHATEDATAAVAIFAVAVASVLSPAPSPQCAGVHPVTSPLLRLAGVVARWEPPPLLGRDHHHPAGDACSSCHEVGTPLSAVAAIAAAAVVAGVKDGPTIVAAIAAAVAGCAGDSDGDGDKNDNDDDDDDGNVIAVGAGAMATVWMIGRFSPDDSAHPRLVPGGDARRPLALAAQHAPALLRGGDALIMWGAALACCAAADASALGGAEGDTGATRVLLTSLTEAVSSAGSPRPARAAYAALAAVLSALRPYTRMDAVEALLGAGREDGGPIAGLLLTLARDFAAQEWPQATAGGASVTSGPPPSPFVGPRLLALAVATLNNMSADSALDRAHATAAALNLHRWVLLREAAGGTNWTGGVGTQALRDARANLMPLHAGLAALAAREDEDENGNDNGGPPLQALSLASLASRVLELIDARLDLP